MIGSAIRRTARQLLRLIAAGELAVEKKVNGIKTWSVKRSDLERLILARKLPPLVTG
jgi:hypothetical protein